MSLISHTRAYLVAVALLIPALALAQSATGVSGVVQDTSGAPIPGAAVKVVNDRSNAAVDLFTDQQGAYRAVTLTPGAYRIEVALDAPPPLEDTGGPQVKDISGSVLPGISKWAYSLGGEYVHRRSIAGVAGELFGALDTSYRSSVGVTLRLTLHRN
jgi:hypothetical protein